MAPAVSFVGWSNSGKTTFISKVIRELKSREISVAVVKNTCHDIETDIPGKDTWNFAQAGADTVILNGPGIYVCQEKVSRRKDISTILKDITGVDIIILEGAADPNIPKVEIWRKSLGEKNRFPAEDLIALVAEGHPEKGYEKLPLFKHNEIGEFTDFLLYSAGLAKRPYKKKFRDNLSFIPLLGKISLKFK
ncbi:molybdopterin-guanine dinucleotide biosynthesis adapter protein [Oxobacter pfennigii]|uniref:Molybdopterin-guanine dinucleotide biosynthesis adapter protein n=1 Tax=Oxobacter pfennigii TaxID=36849 RepID=A0A0P8YUJ7_9CLOT|nr:molybdopterin-guanine dinucleotide biosynthesis protein B [Oxobacter pfennigii]KPU43374.1 molybdopterin-guanine dinucleotide biosynthesis adapter protein [Oxobacter pfennigii]